MKPSPRESHREKQAREEKEGAAELDRVAQLFIDTFSSPSGSEVLDHLCSHFGLLDRVYIRDHEGRVDAVRAAVRDGERGVLTYILKAIKHGTKDKKLATITLPLP